MGNRLYTTALPLLEQGCRYSCAIACKLYFLLCPSLVGCQRISNQLGSRRKPDTLTPSASSPLAITPGSRGSSLLPFLPASLNSLFLLFFYCFSCFAQTE